ncbi:MAG: NUDIX pyrophosphatase [Gammaproteobacteria bacterium]
MSEQREMERHHVVTAFLRHRGKILLVRRSGDVGSYRGRWSGISGYLEDPSALEQARREIGEETGLPAGEVELVVEAPALTVEEPELGRCWVVHPFLFEVANPQSIRLDWENTELRWVEPQDLASYATVPRLADALQGCLERERTP